jgi:5'-deoxynucleotidase YfbR-like HD superfamily hydrolase
MEKEKQIEEMANTLGDTWVVDLEGDPHDLSEVLMRCDIETIAEQLHDAGYRKASEVAAEIIAEIEENFEIGYGGVLEFKKLLAELKNKFTEEKDDDR